MTMRSLWLTGVDTRPCGTGSGCANGRGLDTFLDNFGIGDEKGNKLAYYNGDSFGSTAYGNGYSVGYGGGCGTSCGHGFDNGNWEDNLWTT